MYKKLIRLTNDSVAEMTIGLRNTGEKLSSEPGQHREVGRPSVDVTASEPVSHTAGAWTFSIDQELKWAARGCKRRGRAGQKPPAVSSRIWLIGICLAGYAVTENYHKQPIVGQFVCHIERLSSFASDGCPLCARALCFRMPLFALSSVSSGICL